MELDRLIVHEIDTHILRHENGKKQNSLIYAYGLPDYITTEEGLALFSEFQNNLLTSQDMIKYCTRLIAAYKSFHLGFYDLFKYIEPFVGTDLAFDITMRIKRGLINTNEKGGFTKDQVYYKGFKLISSLSLNTIKKLYIGKIGINNIKEIPDISNKFQMNLKLPAWLY